MIRLYAVLTRDVESYNLLVAGLAPGNVHQSTNVAANSL